MFFAFFFFNDTATTEIYTLSLHDALPCPGIGPIWARRSRSGTYRGNMTFINRRVPAVGRKWFTPVCTSGSNDFPSQGIHAWASCWTTESHGPHLDDGVAGVALHHGPM